MADTVSVFPGTALAGMPVAWTDILDLTATQTVNFTNWPAMPGYIAIGSTSRLVTTSHAGTISTSFTFNGGNDASHVNLFPSQTPATTAHSSIGTDPIMGSSFTGASAPLAGVDLATRPTIVITAGATGTGGFVWRARIAVLLIIIPIT